MTTYGYMRVSTSDQSNDMQRDALLKAGVPLNHIFEEKLSGKNRKRPQLQTVLSALQPGDTLVIWKLDRLGRSLRDLKDIVDDLHSRDIKLKSLREDIQTDSAIGKLFFHLLCAFAEFEREMIVERTTAGLQTARAKGTRLGRKSAVPYDINNIRQLLRQDTVRSVAKSTGLSLSTVARISSASNRSLI